MNLFTKQLKALRITMSRVAPDQFDMASWECGTAACICGHQAIEGDLAYFPKATLEYMNPSECSSEIAFRASCLSTDLDDACEAMFSTEHLAQSIWQSFDRQISAINSKLLTQEQLNHPHLTTDSSPADVVDYIDMLLGVIK
jgi:hypothetical protein